jgi:hypothetical protein
VANIEDPHELTLRGRRFSQLHDDWFWLPSLVNRGRRERSSAQPYGRSTGRVGWSPTQVSGEFGDGVADGYVESAFG